MVFQVMSPLLKVAKIAITRLSLGLSPQNQRMFIGQGHYGKVKGQIKVRP